MKDFFKFALAALRKPAAVGTIFPATKFLANEMVKHVQLKQTDYVVELGPGTGPITEAIDDLLINKSHFVGVEIYHDMIVVLRENFPHLRFEEGSAETISAYLPGGQKATHVFSSLPWTLFPMDLQERIMNEVVRVLAPNGKFIAYALTSGLMSPTSQHFQSLMRKHFKTVAKSTPVWLNIPPATVFHASDLK